MNHSAGAAFAAVIVTVGLACSNPDLGDRPCACLQGFRCRLTPERPLGTCVPLTAEICDGEDNDGNGFVDEDLYRVAGLSVQGPWGSSPPALAFGGDSYLAAWLENPGDDLAVRYQLLDATRTPIGSSQVAHTVVGAAVTLSANPRPVARAGPDGFAIAYPAFRETGRTGSLYDIWLVRVDAGGRSGTPARVATVSDLNTLSLALVWDADGPAVVLRTPDAICETEGCSFPGLYVARPGQLAWVEGSESAHQRRSSSAGGGAALVVGWTQCPGAEDGGRPLTNCSGAPGDEAPSAQLRRLGADPVASTISAANAIALTWLGEKVLAVWEDVSDGQRPRLVAQLLGDHLEPAGALIEISDQVSSLEDLQVVPRGGEALVAWSSHPVSSSQLQSFFARIDPLRGRIGAPVEIPTQSSLGDALAVAAGYDLLMRDPATLVTVRCLGEAPVVDGGLPAPDGGGGERDGGAIDGGAIDGGHTPPAGPACPAPDADGGSSVRGRIRLPGGEGMGGLQVVIGSCRTPADEDGRFAAGGVAPPYDLSVLVPYFGGTLVFSYLGASTSDPEVVLPYLPRESSDENHTTISWSYAVPADSAVQGYVVAPGIVDAFPIPSGSGTQSFAWQGVSPSQADVVILERSGGGVYRRMQYFPGQTISDAATLPLGALSPSDIASRVVAGSQGGDWSSLSLQLGLGGEALTLENISSFSSAFAFESPVLPVEFPGRVYVEAYFAAADGSARVASEPLGMATEPLTLQPPTIPTLLAPAHGASGVGPLPVLEVGGIEGTTLILAEVLSEASVALFVYTDRAPISLPDLGAFGISFEGAATAQWVVNGFRGGPALGELLTGRRSPIFAFGDERPGPGESWARSEGASFSP